MTEGQKHVLSIVFISRLLRRVVFVPLSFVVVEEGWGSGAVFGLLILIALGIIAIPIWQDWREGWFE